MNNINIHFSDFFGIAPVALEEYGAFNVSLIVDMPVFIDPFRLFASEKKEYQVLHAQIIQYLCFLRDYCQANKQIDAGKMREYFCFPEVKNLYMGFSETGNKGRGLGKEFAELLYRCFTGKLRDFGNETVTKSSHLEKLCIIADGVGRDFVSDFSANLIKGYLLQFTEDFAKKYLASDRCEIRAVNRAYFDYVQKVWRDKEYYLPVYEDDYVLLSPRDMLTRDDTWISHRGLMRSFNRLPLTIGDAALRSRLSDLIESVCDSRRKISETAKRQAYQAFLEAHPEIADWYIKDQEDHKEEALQTLTERINETETIFVKETRAAVSELSDAGFYDKALSSVEEARQKIGFFKTYIEDQDGYRLFYDKKGKRLSETHMHLAFRLLWYGSDKDVNREVNNGRGPVDFKISFGNGDKCVIEFKWASNTKLKSNLQFQSKTYAKANGTRNKLNVVLYTSKQELSRVNGILAEIGKVGDKDIILIDASNKKQSASNLKSDEFSFDDDLPNAPEQMSQEGKVEFEDVDFEFPELDM